MGMDYTSRVIRVLDDAHQRSIEYANREWLRNHVEDWNVQVCVEDCEANVFDIAEAWDSEYTSIVQDGKIIHFKNDFHPGKEALLITRHSLDEPHMVFLYTPK